MIRIKVVVCVIMIPCERKERLKGKDTYGR